jgi:transposase
VKLVKQSDRTMADIAMELGLSAKSIGEWVRLSEESGDSISEDERIELKRLRKEVRELRMEKEILAKATAFFGTLKNELIYRRPWLDRESARDAISEYTEMFYNRIRRHSTIGNISPAKFEEMELAQAA